MSYDLQFEKFKNVYDFNRAISTRKNNSVMQGENESQKTGGWSGTKTYQEAQDLLLKGWSAKVEEMKLELKKYSQTVERTRVRYKPSVVGQAPIVAASVKGVPKQMWRLEQKKKLDKKNYLHIYFNNTGSACEDAEDLMKSGMTILKLCIYLEKAGIKVKVDILPYVGEKGDSVYGVCIEIKDYQQPFNLQKMAYPIAHTSVFRRQGFKWLETMIGCTNQGFSSGYGAPLEKGRLETAFKEKFKLNEPGSVYITYYDCKKASFEPENLIRNFGIMKNYEK